MPLKTPHFDLTAFTAGDTILSSVDRRRFTIVDNQLSFQADLIGDGVIDGWNLVDISGTNIKITPGLGIIDGFVTSTYGNVLLPLQDNHRTYLYMRRKLGVVGDLSAFSTQTAITFTDTGNPTEPASLVATAAYNSISLHWTANTDLDLDHYNVYRSLDNSTFTLLASVTTNSYIDSDVEQDTPYYYYLVAVDVNNNLSPASTTLSTATTVDTRIPNDPVNVESFVGNATMQIYWGSGGSLADSYSLVVQEIDTEGIPQNAPTTYSVVGTQFYKILTGLTNGQSYLVTVYSVSATGILSGGVSVKGEPIYTTAPSEIDSFIISDYAVDASWNVAINLSWTHQIDSYSPPAAYYLLTIKTQGEDSVPTIYTDNSVTLVKYTLSDGTERNIQQETAYSILVQGVDSDGIATKGFVIKIRTKRFRPPAPISSLDITTSFTTVTKFVHASWVNSATDFSYNKLTVKKKLINAPFTETTLLNGINYGNANTYALPPNLIDNKCLYTFQVQVYDAFDNHSDIVSGAAVISVTLPSTVVVGKNQISGIRPPVPTDTSSISGNDQVTIYWTAADTDFAAKYRLYRATDAQRNFLPDDFALVGEVDASFLSFTDYTVTNDEKYFYFITTVDSFGAESANPSDNFINYALIPGEPRSHSHLSKPPNISINVALNSALLTWPPDPGDFDGYLIFRSDINNYSWKQIGSVSSNASSFVDSGSLKKSGTYYYMIRKYRDEGQVYPSSSKTAPAGSVALGVVTISDGAKSINTTQLINIKNLQTPILREVANQFSVPTHLYYKVNDDRRIRLSDELVVEDWTTQDFIVYNTTVDIEGTGQYIVYINGVQSPIVSSIDTVNGNLYFEQATKDITTKDPDPAIRVIFLNVGEVSGVLPASNFDEISAAKITKGLFSQSQLPKIDHLGRYKEPCFADRILASRLNGNQYLVTTPAGVTFYDVLTTSTDSIVAACNDGIRLSAPEGGNVWIHVLPTQQPVTKLYYSATYQWWIALIAAETLYSTDLLTWTPIPGITGATVLRDIIEDAIGNIYVSADSGVYRVKPGEFTKLTWEQTGTIDSNNNSAYGLFFDEHTVFVSVGSGIYKTTNTGITWLKYSDNELQVPVYSFFKSANSLFVVSQNRVWRRNQSETTFTHVVTFDVQCRQTVVFQNAIYVTTDLGLYRSTSGTNIYQDVAITFEVAFKSMNRNGIIPPVFGIRNIATRMWLCSDERIYSVTANGNFNLHAELAGICPTVYVNGVERNVGVTYGTGSVYFDERQDTSVLVEVINQYTNFSLKNGGWADIQYDAPVILVINGIDQVAPPTIQIANGRPVTVNAPDIKPSTDAASVANSTGALVLPIFDARNANFDAAKSHMTNIVKIQDLISTDALLNGTTVITPDRVASLFTEVELFRSNVHKTLWPLIKLPPVGGTFTTPSGITCQYDAVNGKIFILNGVDKYTRVAFTIKGVGLTNTGELSHKELEDAFSLADAGLPSALASVQQSNLIKMGIFHQILEPEDLADRNCIYQGRYKAACDDWYVKLDSTLDYKLEVDQQPVRITGQSGGFSINYPADTLYVAAIGEVWVCGAGGIIAVDTTTYECRKIYQSEFYFYNMHLSEGTVYALAEDGLYQIVISTSKVTKNVDISLPSGYTSVLQFGDTTYIATKTGLYAKRPFEVDWRLIFQINNSFVRATGKLTFCIGTDPNDDATTVVYYSYSGIIWNRSDQFPGIAISGASQRFDSIYYATDHGLIVEDLAGLFGNGTTRFSSVDLDGDGASDSTVVINATDADDSLVVAATSDGVFYVMSGSSVSSSGESRLETIHKVKVVAGKYWLFAGDLIDIQGASRLIHLSTGKALL